MNKIHLFILSILFSSTALAQSKEYLDLGVVINLHEDIALNSNTQIDYMLSINRSDFIKKELNTISTKLEIEYGLIDDIIINNKLIINKDLINIELLYLTENYIKTISHIEENIPTNTIPNQHILTLADALYRVGDYKRASTILNNAPTNIMNDDYWLLKGLVHKELGETKKQINAFNTILEFFPNSDYILVAKLQHKMLTR